MRKNRMKVILAVCAVLFLLLCLGNYARKEYFYRTAQKWISQGDYNKAYDVLQNIEEDGFKDTKALIRLCWAHQSYANGDIEEAWMWAAYMPGGFQSESQNEEYHLFRDQVKEDYDAYMKEKEEKEKRELEEKIRTGVPFVGMSESDIGKTSLGAPSSKVRHNNEAINGEIYRANLYDFYDGNAIIFTARCVRGTVTEVWDSRDNPLVQRPSDTKKPESEDLKDPYNASDYSHPDDFYYDHYDDFFDYYDAEDYWYDHHG